MSRRYDPRRGRWTLTQNIRAFLEESAGPVTEEQLLRHLKILGYYVPTLKPVLPRLVHVDQEGHVSLRGE